MKQLIINLRKKIIKTLKKVPTKLDQGKLWSHQIKMLRYALSTQHPALIVDMRMGKTRVVVRVCKIYGANNILIVGPYSTFDSWRKELELIGEEPIEIIGTTDDRLTELESNWATCKWFMINKEGYSVVPQVKNYPWDVVILDESTFIKNPKTQATQFFNANFRDVKHRWILSALPDPEGEMDYFGQLRFLDRNILPFKNWYEFQRKYFESDVEAGFGYKITSRGKAYLSLQLAKYCFFMTKEDAGIKNTKVYEKRVIKMPPDIRKAYKTAEREFLLEIDGKEFKRTMFAGAKYVLMRQLLGGIYDGEVLWKGKLLEVEQLILGELKKEQIIIWCSYRDEARWVYDYLWSLKIKCALIWGSTEESYRTKIINNFNKGYTRILIITAGCMKFGSNLSKASTCIYYSSPFGEARYQSEERIVSIIGPPSLIVDLVVKDSVEEDIYEQRLIKQSERLAIRNLIKKWQYEENKNLS